MDIACFLLLSCLGLSITVQAQDCSRPVPELNINLMGIDDLSQTFPDGTKVSLACDVGYTSAEGSADITCTAGSWSPVTLICEMVTCYPPSVFANGNFSPNQDNYVYSDAVQYSCDAGYTLHGSTSRTCSVDGTFTPDPPACVKKSCGSAGEVTNGRIDYPEGTTFGDKAVITCDTGYTLVGKSEITCGDAGWSGLLPKCEVVTCDPPSVFANGKFSPNQDNYVYSDAVQYSCDAGYTLHGSTTSSCSVDGTFTPDPPTCVRKSCGSAGEVTNGHVDYPDGTRFGDKAVIRCDTGYTLVGKSEITCGDPGWSDRLPVCEVVTCDPPSVFANGIFSPNKDSYVYLDVVQYSCEKYYTLIGSKSRTCSVDGTFRPDPPTCVDQTCPRPVPGPNMNLKGNNSVLEKFPDATKVSFACDVGYTSSAGSPVITCTIGSWSLVTLTCEKKNCGSAGEVTSGQVDYPEGTKFGDKAVITCDTGHTLVGKNERICRDHGWSDRLPVCEVVACDPPPVFQNGSLSPNKDDYVYLDVVQYSCIKDYTLIGSKSRTCSEDGTFKPDSPACVDQNCRRPVPRSNMNWKENNFLLEKFPHGTKVSFSCDVGYMSAGGSPVITCTAGSWSLVTLKCKKKSCGSAGEVTNGRIDYCEGTEFGDKAVITCDTGYTLVGESEITCGDRGWSGLLPKCEDSGKNLHVILSSVAGVSVLIGVGVLIIARRGDVAYFYDRRGNRYQ